MKGTKGFDLHLDIYDLSKPFIVSLKQGAWGCPDGGLALE